MDDGRGPQTFHVRTDRADSKYNSGQAQAKWAESNIPNRMEMIDIRYKMFCT